MLHFCLARARLPRVYVGLVLACGALCCQAQSTPAKQAGGNKTLGGGAGNGKPMKYEELRQCLMQQDSLKLRQPELQRQREALNHEREGIVQQTEAIKSQNGALAALAAKVKDFNARMAVQTDKVDAWKQRQEDFNTANRSGGAAERQRKELERDLAELQKNETALKAESEGLAAEREKLVAGLNDGAASQEQAANDWNVRSHKLDEALQAYEDERQDWKARCADRPYREDDEKLIRSGK